MFEKERSKNATLSLRLKQFEASKSTSQTVDNSKSGLPPAAADVKMLKDKLSQVRSF
jgi:hypothetical protein